jgi:hypothetical protein
VRAELASFLAGRRVWPSRKEFEAGGRKALRDAIGRTGGVERWSGEFALPITDHRRGSRRVWDDARIEVELRALLAGRSEWPTRTEFQRAGLASLLSAIYRHGGGPERWARKLGVHRAQQRQAPRPTSRWTEGRIEAELREFTVGARSWPGSHAFAAAGRERLYRAASLYGGIPRWRRRLGL